MIKGFWKNEIKFGCDSAQGIPVCEGMTSQKRAKDSTFLGVTITQGGIDITSVHN